MAALWLYTTWRRAAAKLFCLLSARAFASYGRHSVLALPVRVAGARYIRIGDGVFIGPGSFLHAERGSSTPCTLHIEDGVRATSNLTISATSDVTIKKNVLIAPNVYIADHSHRYGEIGKPVVEQGDLPARPVEIGEGAWIGFGVLICPGVRIGRGAVIGANSVVRDDVPDYCVAVGAPARVVKQFGPHDGQFARNRAQAAADAPTARRLQG